MQLIAQAWSPYRMWVSVLLVSHYVGMKVKGIVPPRSSGTEGDAGPRRPIRGRAGRARIQVVLARTRGSGMLEWKSDSERE